MNPSRGDNFAEQIPAEQDLVEQALEWVRAHRVDGVDHHDRGTTHTPVTAATDLLELGVLDSLGFVQLIAFLSERSGRTRDLVDLEVDDLATVTSLCRVFSEERTDAH